MKRGIVGVDELGRISEAMRAEGKKLVVTNGCFDLLHVGHVRYLETARRLGDALAIGVNGDTSVRTLKGESRPLNSEHDRAEVLAALACVEFVAIFQEVRATHFLECVRPAVYVKGGDYNTDSLNPEEREVLERIPSEIRIIPFESGYSTSRLIERMNGV